MTNFLSLIGLLSLLVGGLGVAMTIHAYLQQKLDTIAILKCLGARSRQIMRLYLIQGLLIGVLGSRARGGARLRRPASFPAPPERPPGHSDRARPRARRRRAGLSHRYAHDSAFSASAADGDSQGPTLPGLSARNAGNPLFRHPTSPPGSLPAPVDAVTPGRRGRGSRLARQFMEAGLQLSWWDLPAPL